MRILAFILLLLGILSFWSQNNLVINPGFEETNYSSTGIRELRKSGYLSNFWYSPLAKRSPELYMIPERSVAKANSGQNAVGMVLGGTKKEREKTEYITGHLSVPLVAGKAYCVSFNVLLHRTSKWAASNVGVLIHHDQNIIENSNDLKSLEASLYANDGDFITNTKWLEYNGYYIASGGEKYITLGVFGQNESIEISELDLEPYFQLDGMNSKAYYQFDDVSVIAQADGVDCGCATPPIQEEIEVFEDREMKPYLFALDASGSMKRGGVFDSLRNSLRELLEHLPIGTPVTFSTFSSNSSLIYSGKLNPNTPREVDSLLGAIELAGGTSVYSGLENASKSWESQSKDSARLVLISDGTFTVTNNIEQLVKNQFENKGRNLTIIQIANKAKNAERLEPYQTNFISVPLSELRSAIFQVYRKERFGAVACECKDAYSDTMNYHFIIDYSGSMSLHKNRAKKAVLNLYEQAPETAVISITSFSTEAIELYVGKKSEMSLDELANLLSEQSTKGGTDPTPGVRHSLDIANNMAMDRFSHLIIVTDLEPEHLNDHGKMISDIRAMSNNIDLAVCAATVDLESQIDLLVSGRSQFDITSGVFREVSKAKFEKDLFETKKSGCDYTTQPYHYNPATDVAKKEAKKAFRIILKELLGVGVTLNT